MFQGGTSDCNKQSATTCGAGRDGGHRCARACLLLTSCRWQLRMPSFRMRTDAIVSMLQPSHLQRHSASMPRSVSSALRCSASCALSRLGGGFMHRSGEIFATSRSRCSSSVSVKVSVSLWRADVRIDSFPHVVSARVHAFWAQCVTVVSHMA